jgi:hypothetical protein
MNSREHIRDDCEEEQEEEKAKGDDDMSVLN